MDTWKEYTFDEIKDEILGPIGTPRRDTHEREVSKAVKRSFQREVRKEAMTNQRVVDTQKDVPQVPFMGGIKGLTVPLQY